MTEDELLTLWESMLIPDRDPDMEGARSLRGGRSVRWDYWDGEGRGLCYFCGAGGKGRVLTDAAADDCIVSLTVCGRHRPDRWQRRHWAEMANQHAVGPLH